MSTPAESFYDRMVAGAQLGKGVVAPTGHELVTGAKHVLFVLAGNADAGVDPGPFLTSLIHTISLADSASDQIAFAQRWPALVATVATYQRPGGESVLTRMATIDHPPAPAGE